MTYCEDDLLPISALQHLLFCERQCALIHIEQVWAENLFTAEGRILHETVDSGHSGTRAGVRIVRSLPLRSLHLGLVGLADVVEFGPAANEVYPVEYKRGRNKTANWDRVQLCAQAMCLEEMLRVRIDEGALFYGKARRRQRVGLDAGLRAETTETADRLHRLVAAGRTPPASYEPRCDSCSLLELCLPRLPKNRSVGRYLMKMLEMD